MLNLKERKRLSDSEAEKKAGTFLDEKDFDTLLTEDADVDCADTGEPILRFRKNVLPSNFCKDAYESLKDAPHNSYNRGIAGGKIDPEEMSKKRGEIVILGGGTRYKYKTGNGKMTNTLFANEVKSGIVGYFDRYARIPYCRQTAFNQTEMRKFKKAWPLIKRVDEWYARLVPELYGRQRSMADKTSQDFVIKDTAFTTVTVNKNWQTAVHKDVGDYAFGFGNLTVMRAGKYEGGYTVFPQYRLAVDVCNRDVLLMDVHRWHGNSPIRARDMRKFVRLSLVMYYRKKMINCGTAEQELERAKRHGAKGIGQDTKKQSSVS